MSKETRSTLHVGIIMDGNRRWAKSKSVPVIEGHRQGYKNLKKLLQHVKTTDIPYISVYAFSTENWSRSKDEVSGLLKLLRWVLSKELNAFIKAERRVVFLGSKQHVPNDLLDLIALAEQKTAHFTGGTLAICFNYGGQQEIVDAVQSVLDSGDDHITNESISRHLYHPEVPPLDLVIRTSGEQRLSNFLLWRAAYAEFAFTSTLWPAFTSDEFDKIMEDFSNRHRRFGN